jgi:hypothetical protein
MWIRESTLDQGGLRFQSTFRFTYEGVEQGLDRIKMDGTLKMLPVMEGDRWPTEVRKPKLTNVSVTGAFLFDRGKGRVVKLTVEDRVEGNVQIKVENVKTPVTLRQTHKLVIRNTEKNPLAP